MTLDDAMKHLQPLADLVDSHGHQKEVLGVTNGLTEISRTGELDSEEKLIIRLNNNCEQVPLRYLDHKHFSRRVRQNDKTECY